MAQICFILLLSGMGWLIYRRFYWLAKSIHVTLPMPPVDRPKERIKQVLLLAFGQKKMFEQWPIAVFHLFLYVGFLLINIEVLEIVLDGVFGTHRLFAPFLGHAYPLLIHFFESLAALVFLSCLVFLLRRWLFKVPRLQHPDLKGFPRRDALQILLIEMVLMGALWTMNAADALLQSRGQSGYPLVGSFVVSQHLIPLFSDWSNTSLILLERGAWWLHIAGILGFALYLSYSKHLHIIFAFPATYYASLEPYGQMTHMPQVLHEVQLMLGQNPTENPNPSASSFGAKDVFELNMKNALDAYSCTECGRCTDACPANASGRLLSPRKILMSTRDRLEEVARQLKVNHGEWKPDGKSLLGDYISAEELRACTTCQACVEACPIQLSPLDIILALRRYQIMEQSDAPSAWNALFANIETNQSPWKFNPDDRLNWAKPEQS